MKKYTCKGCGISIPCSLTVHVGAIGTRIPSFCPVDGDDLANWQEVKSKSKE